MGDGVRHTHQHSPRASTCYGGTFRECPNSNTRVQTLLNPHSPPSFPTHTHIGFSANSRHALTWSSFVCRVSTCSRPPMQSIVYCQADATYGCIICIPVGTGGVAHLIMYERKSNTQAHIALAHNGGTSSVPVGCAGFLLHNVVQGRCCWPQW